MCLLFLKSSTFGGSKNVTIFDINIFSDRKVNLIDALRRSKCSILSVVFENVGKKNEEKWDF